MTVDTRIDDSPFAPWPVFADDEIDAVTAVLRSGKVNYWTGEEGLLFEQEYAEFTKTKHAIAASNGTVAIEMALHGLMLQPGDEVIVPSRTFIATASAVVARGGVPVVVDVDRDSGNLTAETIAAAITPRTKGVIAVHLAGWPCDMDSILALAKSHGLFVIEDCAQAHGAEYKGRPVGSMGDAGCFSFCQDKILTTGGEGGMLVTNNTELWEKAWSLKDHGKSPSAFYDRQPSKTFQWLHESFGTNFRLSEMQSSIGRIILRKLSNWVTIRREHATRLRDACNALSGLRTPMPSSDCEHAYYKFYTYLKPEELATGWDRQRIIESIHALGVPCFSGSCSEIYRENAFRSEWKPSSQLSVAAELGKTSLMFLVHPTLSRQSIERTCRAITETMLRATARASHQRSA